MTVYKSLDACMKSINSRPFLLQRSKRRGLALMMVLCLLLCLVFNGAIRQSRIVDNLESIDSLKKFSMRQGVEKKEKENVVADLSAQKGISPGWRLVEDTRATIAAAGGVPSASLSREERKAWDVANPCAGRRHLLKLWTKPKRFTPPTNSNTTTQQQGSEASTLLQVLFNEYAILHRTCTRGGDMEYVTQLFKSGNESSTPCKFSVVEFGPHGVGNRLLWLISAYQYALLTQRVLVMDSKDTLHQLLCEPFPGSSWSLPDNFPFSSDQKWPQPKEFQTVWDNWENWENRELEVVESRSMNAETLGKGELKVLSEEDIAKEKRDTKARIRAEIRSKANVGRLSNTDDDKEEEERRRRLTAGEGNSNPVQKPHFHHVQANEGWAPHTRFFCDNEHEHLQQVKWINFIQGCLYFLPDLFAIPTFQTVLEDLFPNMDPATHLLRQLTLPVDSIWEKVLEVYIKEFRSTSKVVGMQVRYRDGTGMYRNLNSIVNQRISQCSLDHGLIPGPAAAAAVGIQTEGPLVIFIASLFDGLREHLEREYEVTLKKKNERSSLKVVQLSRAGFQAFDLEGDHQAFLEIICLSLVDEILTSPQSTYGQIAQALGGLTPWLIDFQHRGAGERSPNCVRGQSTDACFQFPTSQFSCPFNKDVDGKQIAEVLPYLRTCQDLADGLQLVPHWSP
ncbi:unnamed protein product [Calypogeia fissa]